MPEHGAAGGAADIARRPSGKGEIRMVAIFLAVFSCVGGAIGFAAESKSSNQPKELPVSAEMAVAAMPVAVTAVAPSPLQFDDLPRGGEGELIRYGWRIIDNTPAALGSPATTNRLSCRNCHLDHGTRESAFSWRRATEARPRYQAREGHKVSLAEQVNLCLQRSLNRSPLPDDSLELQGVLAYLRFLAEYPAAPTDAGREPYIAPDRTADPVSGEGIYRQYCAECHGAPGDTAQRNTPPLWGAASYTEGAEMHRLLTAAAFIHANMPPNKKITAEEAYDAAAFINSFHRPPLPNLARDYPALREKPVDCPYPPYPDQFSASQHKYGPFAPMERERLATGAADFRLYRQDRRQQLSATSPEIPQQTSK